MIILDTYKNIPPELHDFFKNSVVALGNFDGVHRGHQTVIGEARKKADELGSNLILLTFKTHPRSYFLPNEEPFIITPLDAKSPLLKALGVDGVMALKFADVKDMKAQDFINTILVNALQVKCVSVGYDFQFGKNRIGTSGMLNECDAFKTIIALPQKSLDGLCNRVSN